MKKFKETRYITALVVLVPSASAAMDMMRYDSCFPATEADAHKLMRLITAERADLDMPTGLDRIIRLTRVARNDAPPTEGRWRSFSCWVLDYGHPEAEPLSDEVLLDRARAVTGMVTGKSKP